MQFLSQMMGHYNIGRQAVQISLLRYATGGSQNKVIWYLNRYQDRSALQAAFNSVGYEAGSSWDTLANALNAARTDVFVNNGARQNTTNVAQVAVVVTHGYSSGAQDVFNAAAGLRSSSVHILCVGVTSQVSVEQLTAQLSIMASDINEILIVSSYATLNSVETNLTTYTCGRPTSTSTTSTATTEVCDEALDLVFMVDGDAQIPEASWTNLMQFLSRMMEHYNIGPHAVQVSLMRYAKGGSNNTVIWYLNQFSNRLSLQAALNNTLYQAGSSWDTIVNAINVASSNVFVNNGARQNKTNVSQVAVIFSHDSAVGSQEAVNAARSLKDAGIYIVGIWVVNPASSAQFSEQLSFASSTPYEVLVANNYETLNSVETSLFSSTCRSKTSTSIGNTAVTASVSNTLSASWVTETTKILPPDNSDSSTNLAVGLAVGLGGGAVIIAIIIILVFCIGRRNSKKNRTTSVNMATDQGRSTVNPVINNSNMKYEGLNASGDVHKYRALDSNSINSSGYDSIQYSGSRSLQTYASIDSDLNSYQYHNGGLYTETVRAQGYQTSSSNISSNYVPALPSRTQNAGVYLRVPSPVDSARSSSRESDNSSGNVSGNTSQNTSISISNNPQGYDRVQPSDGASLHSYLTLDPNTIYRTTNSKQKAPSVLIVDQRRQTLQPL